MKILLAEDEARIAADVATALRASGMAVDVVHDGETAWFAGDVENYALPFWISVSPSSMVLLS